MSAVANPLPYFGRAWSVQIQTQNGDTLVLNSKQSPGLRVEFRIDTYLYLIYWTAEITITNLSSTARQNVTQGVNTPSSLQDWLQHWTPLSTNTPVTISAGYQATTSGGTFDPTDNIIFQGKVLQTIWLRPGVVDYQLVLRCVIGLFENSFNFVLRPGASVPQGLTMQAGGTAFDAIGQVLSASNVPLAEVDNTAKDLLSQQKLSRGVVAFDRPFSVVKNLLAKNRIFGFMKHDGLHLRSFNPTALPEKPDFAYAPPNLPWANAPADTQIRRSLIGVPQQTQDGIQFHVLMDAAPQIGDTVQLAPGTIVSQAKITPGKLPPIRSKTGVYVIAGLRYVGDTRGTDWYTEISGLSYDYFSQLFAAKAPGT